MMVDILFVLVCLSVAVGLSYNSRQGIGRTQIRPILVAAGERRWGDHPRVESRLGMRIHCRESRNEAVRNPWIGSGSERHGSLFRKDHFGPRS